MLNKLITLFLQIFIFVVISTSLYSQCTSNIGTGTIAMGFPFYTSYTDSKVDMLYLANEITAGGCSGSVSIIQIGFDIHVVSTQVMNGFNVKMKHTSETSVTGFTDTGWTTCYSGTYSVPGAGWQYIVLQNNFIWDGINNLLIEICFDNTTATFISSSKHTAIANKMWQRVQNNSSGCALTVGSTYGYRPNIKLVGNSVVSIQHNNQVPKSFVLEQNYPNPFNPTTNIKYQIVNNSFVSLKVYDILGREVETLVNESLKPGTYEVDFDGSNLSSGVYYYRMEAGNYFETKKMLLVK